MKIVLVLLAVIDLSVGLMFGSIGHFYSILCFPLIALLRGYLGVSKGSRSIKNSLFLSLIGASLFFVGLVIGIFIRSGRIPEEQMNVLMTNATLANAFITAVFVSLGYFLLYIFFGFLAGFLCKETTKMLKLPRKGVRSEV